MKQRCWKYQDPANICKIWEFEKPWNTSYIGNTTVFHFTTSLRQQICIEIRQTEYIRTSYLLCYAYLDTRLIGSGCCINDNGVRRIRYNYEIFQHFREPSIEMYVRMNIWRWTVWYDMHGKQKIFQKNFRWTNRRKTKGKTQERKEENVDLDVENILKVHN